MSAPLRCRGCGRAFGVTGSPQHPWALCLMPRCADDLPTYPNEARDAVIRELFCCGVTAPDIGTHFGIARQRVYQIISAVEVSA